MNISYLKTAVCDLNAEEDVESLSAFMTATNLALSHISRVLPSECQVLVDAARPILSTVGNVDTARVYSVRGATALVFRAVGSGQLKNGNTVLKIWNSPVRFVAVKYYVTPGADLELKFETSGGAVRDLAVWSRDYGGTAGIPLFGDMVDYDMTQYIDDLGGIAALPRDAVSGVTVPGAVISPSHVLIPSDYSGAFIVSYRHRVTQLTLDDIENDIEIDLDTGLCDLLPLCVSYYIWLDDDKTKANFFLSRFAEQLSLARSSRFGTTDTRVHNNRGW